MQYLFGISREGKTLADYCEQRKAEMEEAVRHWKPEDMLATPDQEVIDDLTGIYSVSCPVLLHNKARSTEAEPVDLPVYSPITGMAYVNHSQSLGTVPGSTSIVQGSRGRVTDCAAARFGV